MKFITASKLLVLPFLASLNAVQALEKDAASKVNSFSSIFQDHRALLEQTMKSRNLQEYSEETQQLLDCWNARDYPDAGNTIIQFNKKQNDQITITDNNECPENFKRLSFEYTLFDALYGCAVITDSVCIPDVDVCPNDWVEFLTKLSNALLADGDAEESAFYAGIATQLSTNPCVQPQCFATASKEYEVSIPYVDLPFSGLTEPFPQSPYSCPVIGGSCEIECEDDDEFICTPELCYTNKDYDAGVGNQRQLKSGKSPKGSKGGSKGSKGSGCTCKVPRANLES